MSSSPCSPHLDPLVASVLSHVVAGHGAKRFAVVNYLTSALWRYSVTATSDRPIACASVLDAIGDPIDYLEQRRHGDLSPCPAGDSVLKRRELTADDVWAQWDAAKDQDGPLASLDRPLLEALVPPVFWNAVEALILDGPGVASERLGRLLKREAKRTVRPTARRPEGGPISDGQVGNLGKALLKLMRALINLQLRHAREVQDALRKHYADEVLSPREQMFVALSPWTALAKVEWPDAPQHVTDTSAPPLSVVRLAYHKLDDEIEEILGCSLAEQPAAIATISDVKAQKLFYRLRHRLLLMLLLITGSRIEALVSCDVDDYRPHRLCADGLHHPAIALRPGKTISRTEVRWKPLPDAAAHVVDAYLAGVERRSGVAWEGSDPLFLAHLPLDRDHTLTHGKQSHQRWTSEAVRAIVGREVKATQTLKSGEARTYIMPPLLPREGDGVGYAPHTVRGTSQQAIRDFGLPILKDLGLPANELVLQLVFESLVDHAVPAADPLGYLGGSKPHGRERYSYLGTEILWRVLTGDSPRRTGDEATYRAAWTRRLALEHERERLDDELARAENAVDINDAASAIAFTVNMQRIARRRTQIVEELADIKGEMHDLRSNPDRHIPVPDDIAVVPTVDFDALDREAQNGTVAEGNRPSASSPLRNWWTPREVAYILTGDPTNTGSTVRRWMDVGPPRNRPYWDGTKPPVVAFSEKRRAIVADGFDMRLLDTDQLQRALELLATPNPDGWETAPAMVKLLATRDQVAT